MGPNFKKTDRADIDTDDRGEVATLNIDLDGQVTYASESCQIVLGIDPRSSVGKPITKLGLNNGFGEKILDHLADVREGLPAYVEDVLNFGNSYRISILADIIPYWADGCPVGAVILAHRNASDVARHGIPGGMDALARYSDGISHELCNLVTIVKGNLNLFAHLLPAGMENEKTFLGAMHGVRRTEQFINQINEFSRRYQIQPRCVDLNEQLANVVRSLRRIVPGNVEFRYEPALRRGNVYVEEHALERVLTSLATSACKAMPLGGTLSIRTSIIDGNEVKKLQLPLFERDYALVKVCDTGPMIKPDQIANMFEPSFANASSNARADLSSVYGFCRRSGGVIDVTSTDAETAFSLLLPVDSRQFERSII